MMLLEDFLEGDFLYYKKIKIANNQHNTRDHQRRLNFPSTFIYPYNIPCGNSLIDDKHVNT
ncbi:hypothetical protein GCM10026983_12250 [Gracilibacillus alcaliphilus]